MWLKRWQTYFDPNKDYGALQDKEISVGDVLAEGGGGEWNKTLPACLGKNIVRKKKHGQLTTRL